MATSSSLAAPHTTMNPMTTTGDSPIIDAWKKALETYKKFLPQKHLDRIQMATGPGDVVKDIEEWQLKQSKRKSIKVAAVVCSGLDRLQRFTASIDMLAQGSPAPGCLLWGSIKFVLTIVQDVVKEYEKLCIALNRMIECLPQIEIYEKTFEDSALVLGCVVDFYESANHFWTQACKSYRRHRLWKTVEKIWDNYEIEFSLLETKMSNNEKTVKESAAAEHMRQAESARTDQHTVNQSLLFNQNSSRKKELTRWLSPTANEVKYYQNDFKAALKKRHPGSCQWLLNKRQFIRFSGSQGVQAFLLWIYAKPGAGKTVLSSYLIDHYQHQRTHSLIYFFCKNSDEDKNTPVSIIRSLLYQLWEIIEGPDYCGTLSDDMEASMSNSGQHRALEFGTMWSLFAAHISRMDQPLVVLDALDECEERKMLTQNLRALSRSHSIMVLITSRPENDIGNMLNEELSLEIRSENTDADIKAFIKSKVSKPPLCQNPVHDMIVDKLSANHDGMFLWTYLVLKELKVCKSVQQVQDALKKLPKGLPAIYKSILQRLCKTLRTPSLELATKVLIWVASASRPLRVKEIHEALGFHYQMDGLQSIADEQSFPYADKEIESACGSLLTIRGGTVQVIHLTVKEFLMTSSTDDSYKQLLVDPATASLQLTKVSLNYISQRLTAPIFDLDAKTNRMDIEVDDMRLQRLQDRREQNPFIEYASFNWPLHFVDYIDCKGDCSDEIVEAIQRTFDSSATFYWIETCLVVDPDSFFHRICSGLEELIEWASDKIDQAPPGSADLYQFLSNWCSVVVRIVHDYGESFAHLPWDVYIVDLRAVFLSNGLGKLYDNYGNFETRESVTFFNGDHSKTSPTVSNPPQIAVSSAGDHLIYDHKRKVFFSLPYLRVRETLYVQEVKTGRRLPRVVDPEVCDMGKSSFVESYATSIDGEYLCILYTYCCAWGNRISIWRLDSQFEFKKTMRTRSEPWARKVFSKEYTFGKEMPTTIGYRADGCFYSPIGRIHPVTGTVLPFPFDTIEDLVSPGDRSVCFSTRGELISFEHTTQVLKLYSHETYVAEETRFPIAAKITKVRASPMGRYLVLTSEPVEPLERMLPWSVYDLYDTTTEELFRVNRCASNTSRLEFSKDDRLLFWMAWYENLRRVEALVFALNDRGPQLCSEAQIDLADTCELAESMSSAYRISIDVCSDENTAWIISKQNIIYSVHLGPPTVRFPQELIANLDFHYHYSRISSDGTRLGVLHYGNHKAQIQTFDLNGAEDPVCCLDLDWPHCESKLLHVGVSRDLSVLVCGENLFHLGAEDGLAIQSFPLVSPAPGQERLGQSKQSYGWLNEDRNPSIFISGDNPSIAYITYVMWEQPPFVYRVNLSSRCSDRVNICGTDGFLMHSALLHPSLPLMLLIYRDNGTLLDQFSTLDLNNLHVKCLAISRRYRSKASEQWERTIRFSDCGTFIVYKTYYTTVLLGNLQIEPKPLRIIGCRSTWHYNECYRITGISGPGVGVDFLAAFRPTSGSSDRGYMKVDSGRFISRPSDVDWGSVRLLLGPTDDDLIRVLLLARNERPLEIRTIRLTFSELRARLIHKWELQNEIRFEAETVGNQTDAAAARVMEIPNRSSSAYISPSDLITLFPDPASSEDDTASDSDVSSGEAEVEDSLEDDNISTGEAEAEDR